MLNFDERDLFRLAEKSGFFQFRLTLRAITEPMPPREGQLETLFYSDFVRRSRTSRLSPEAIESALTDEERDRLTATELRPKIDEPEAQGHGAWRPPTSRALSPRRLW